MARKPLIVGTLALLVAGALLGSFESHVSIFKVFGGETSGALGHGNFVLSDSRGSVQPVGDEELAALSPAVQAELLRLRQVAAAAATGSTGASASSSAALSGTLLRLDEVERRVARLATTRPEAVSALSAELNSPSSSSRSKLGEDQAADAARAEAAALRSEVATLRARVATLTDSQTKAANAAALNAVKEFKEHKEEQQQRKQQGTGPVRRTLDEGQSAASLQTPPSTSSWNASSASSLAPHLGSSSSSLAASTNAVGASSPGAAINTRAPGAGAGAAAAATTGGGGNTCGSWLKVYFYEFPEDLPFMKLARDFKQACFNENKCGDSQYGGENLLAQFSLELILADFFRQSCVRTMDPEEAHFFYVPFFHDVEYRATGRPHDASKHGQAVLDVLEKQDVRGWEREFRVTGKYWKRKWGADHILTLGAPVTGLRHPKGARGWTHFVVQLLNPVFLSVELTKSFLHEFPHCAAKNIVLPYPIPGRDWHNGAWRRKATALFGVQHNLTLPLNPALELGIHAKTPIPPPSLSSNSRNASGGPQPLLPAHKLAALGPQGAIAPVLEKPIFAYYSGGNHGCVNVRSAISKEVKGDPSCLGTQQRTDMGTKFRKLFPREKFDQAQGPPRQIAMFGSLFCACPEGDSPSAKRQYDAVVTGCIPVLVSNEAIYAFSTENGGDLDPKDFSVRITEESVVSPPPGVGGLLTQLHAITPAERQKLQAGVARAAWFYRYYAEHSTDGTGDAMGGNGKFPVDPLVAGALPDGGATEMLLRELERRAGGGRAKACAQERKEPHFSFRFQFCGKAEIGREVAGLKRQLAMKKAGSREAIALKRGIALYEEGWISRRRRLSEEADLSSESDAPSAFGNETIGSFDEREAVRITREEEEAAVRQAILDAMAREEGEDSKAGNEASAWRHSPWVETMVMAGAGGDVAHWGQLPVFNASAFAAAIA